MRYGGHGVDGVQVRVGERVRERRGNEPLALHAPIHQAMLGVGDQEERRSSRLGFLQSDPSTACFSSPNPCVQRLLSTMADFEVEVALKSTSWG